tara:strand:+ start:266 stop:727 length:462 start_codon:yes stop_codon:yes gene_type:complete
MGRLPGEWTGKKWHCADMPKDTAHVYHYCCPDGYKYVKRKSIQRTSTKYKNFNQDTNMRCRVDSDIMACGPKPTHYKGMEAPNLVCCPEFNEWRPHCPEVAMQKIADPNNIMAHLALRTRQTTESVSLLPQLTMIGIPLILIISILMYFIFVN